MCIQGMQSYMVYLVLWTTRRNFELVLVEKGKTLQQPNHHLLPIWQKKKMVFIVVAIVSEDTEIA